jgi:MscS family membrane protein
MKKTIFVVSCLGLFILTSSLFLEEFGLISKENTKAWNIAKNLLLYVFILGLYFFSYTFLLKLINKKLEKQTLKNKAIKQNSSLIKTIFRIVFFVLFFLYSLDFFGININHFLAAGGIAGLAIGFASKEFITNIFGGIVLFMDKPFVEGEWISSPDRNIEGTVKKINLRLTEIETFDKRPIYVPNSTFMSIIIENPNRMKNRRICEEFSLRYKDAEQVRKIVYEIEEYLKNNSAIATNQTLMVHLTRFAPSSLDCQVYCFTESSDWEVYREARQEVMLSIIDIVKRNNADMAFPTRTLELNESLKDSKPPDEKDLLSKKT